MSEGVFCIFLFFVGVFAGFIVADVSRSFAQEELRISIGEVMGCEAEQVWRCKAQGDE